MIKRIHVCDKCGAEVVTQGQEKSNYRTIQYSVSNVDSEFVNVSTHYDNDMLPNRFYLCVDCLLAIGISPKYDVTRTPYEEKKSISEQLMETFISLVAESVKE